ncbi:hypothetical protein NQ314_004221 [Rhamnusium bicolor]|uniref:Uncharacterized protein n=1 Tax=Rhamnusium bicolor TaxID=1586634 RepID=A0AAV8ZKR3_9CUCU|nr:hypothetical protein NQ314_004221 [Rhamnusium bicolor]
MSRNPLLNDIDRTSRLKRIDELIKSQASSLACKQPSLPVSSPEMMKFVHTVPKLDCSIAGEDWVKCVGHECTIQDNVKIKYGPIKCSFTDIIREDDFKLTNGKTTVSETYYKLEESDVVRVHCTSPENKWSATLTGIRIQDNIWDGSNWDNLPPNSLKMDILMFGFDSLSRNAFIRKLPKSYEYLTKVLEAVVLQGYNIVELPDTRKRIKNTKFVNSYPFIWNDYKDAGYITGFFEDVPDLGTFTYRLNGFNFFTVYKTKPKFLFGFHGELSHDDYNLVGVADDDLLECLKELFESGALNNSILIIMADHGHRSFYVEHVFKCCGLVLTQRICYKLKPKKKNDPFFKETLELLMPADPNPTSAESEYAESSEGEISSDEEPWLKFAEVRNTIQGKQEERLPFFSFTFPKWFKEKHKVIYSNFLSNQDKLVTPFDIYTTLKSVLKLENTEIADITQRSVSLFSKIPAERSCSHAYIEPHWCACLDWQEIPVSAPIVERLGETLVHTLNEYTKNYRNLCEVLSISQIHWVTKMSPNQNLLKFNKNADLDGFVADLSANMKIKYDMYQLKVMLSPGNSLFEASITHDLKKDNLQIKLSDISRINMYGRQARCIENDLPQLRKYCYCKDDIK